MIKIFNIMMMTPAVSLCENFYCGFHPTTVLAMLWTGCLAIVDFSAALIFFGFIAIQRH
jgi:hypothetical protein